MFRRSLSVTALVLLFGFTIIQACSADKEVPGAASSCGAECAPCQRCENGQCVAAEDGTACMDGQCHGGACCTGCFSGNECVEGSAANLCGSLGQQCTDCRSTGQTCVASACHSACVFSDVSVASTAVCAIHDSHMLYCWGKSTLPSLEPSPIGESTRWSRLSSGTAHVCGLVSTKDIWCWGDNTDGQLGVDDTAARSAPTRVASDAAFVLVSAGGNNTCAIDEAGHLYCWGKIAAKAAPQGFGADTRWLTVSAGATSNCAIKQTGELLCWSAGAEPAQIGSTANWKAVVVGPTHSCALNTDGALFCWGKNDQGQLGTGNTADTSAPARTGDLTYRAVALGSKHSCAVTEAGELRCWGANAVGQLGLPKGASATVTSPTKSSIADSFASVAAQGNVSCALATSGKLYCFGDNTSGALGNGTTSPASGMNSVCVTDAEAQDAGVSCPSAVDCSLQGCTEHACGSAGQVCRAGACICPETATAEGQCGYVPTCPTTVDCAVTACNSHACGSHGQVCRGGVCICPSGATSEKNCSNGTDDDCDGKTDCEDPDCATSQCGSNSYQRCCSGACVDTSTDEANCQGCGLRCASGKTCQRTSDSDGVRGHCTCSGNGDCPHNPGQICRAGNNDGQDGLCACDVVNEGNSGCASGQSCSNVTKANFCHY